MKKLSALLNTPARAAIAVGMIMLVSELLIMIVIESTSHTILKAEFLEKMAFEFIDPILLIILVSPALLLLIFKPMRAQQAVLERQLDELRRFHNLSIGRELRMKELVEENTALRHPLSVEPAGDIPVTSGSLEAPRDAADQYATTQPTEQNQLNVLLFMLEDLENAHKKIEQAHQEWIAALDVVDDPIFLHDKQFRILRCNRAYQQLAGIPFKQIIGQPYYEVFPKTGAPLPCCLRVMEKAEAAADEEEMVFGDVTYRLRTFTVYGEQGGYLHSVHILEDITERKQVEAAFRTLVGTAVSNVGAAFFHETVRSLSAWLVAECVIVGELVNENRVRALAMQLDGQAVEHYEYALPGTPCDSVAHKGYCEYPEVVCQLFPLDKDLSDMGAEAYIGTPIRGKNGKVIGVLCAISRHKIVPPPMLKGVFEIIAARAGTEIERKGAEDALREANNELQEFFDLVPDMVCIASASDGCFQQVNKIWETTLGFSTDEIIGKSFIDFIHPDDVASTLAEVGKQLAGQSTLNFINRYRSKDGSYKWLEWVATPARKNKLLYAAARDITERKQAEEELRLRAQLLDSASDTIFMVDFDGSFVYLNEAAWKTRGYTRDEMMGINLHVLDTPKYEKRIESRMRDLMENGQSIFESEHCRKDGSAMPIEVSARIIESGGRKLVLSVIRDITERKQAEAAIQHANRALATLSAVNRTLVHATDESELLQTVCNAIVEQKGYRLAWVGYKQHDESKSIKIMACAGHDEGYMDATQLTWAENERGMGPSGRAVRNGATQICQDMANDPQFLPWRDVALKRGYASCISLPLTRRNGKVFGILSVYAGEVNTFSPAEIDLLEEMAGDLAFGVRSLYIRSERNLAHERIQQQLVQLQDSLEDTVRAIATIVEMRDPYTAGHQVRVADLAAAIAKQLGLPEEQVHAIHLAGVVHDLGKIKIPAEILSKPGKITDLEFGLIKVHPQAGYDILKGINFPWPIALMVLQHHERFDGSGYPQGLKGEAILLEARILGVADVVEAMASHRPYRPGLGIEIALAEITRQRGIYFDPQVVDACLALFHEQHYSFRI